MKSKSGPRRNRGRGADASKAVRDNRSRQLNPQNKTYWLDRGYEDRPDKSGGVRSPGTRRR